MRPALAAIWNGVHPVTYSSWILASNFAPRAINSFNPSRFPRSACVTLCSGLHPRSSTYIFAPAATSCLIIFAFPIRAAQCNAVPHQLLLISRDDLRAKLIGDLRLILFLPLSIAQSGCTKSWSGEMPALPKPFDMFDRGLQLQLRGAL